MPKKWAEKLVCVVCTLAIGIGCVTSVCGETKDFLETKGIIEPDFVEKHKIVNLDWQSQYPTKTENNSEATENSNANSQNNGFISKYLSAVQKVEGRIDESIENILGYTKLLEFNQRVNKLLGKKTFDGENSAIQLNNGGLAPKTNKYSDENLEKTVENITDLSEYCDELDVPFAYVQTPRKICKYDEQLPVGVTDYANYNCDAVVEALKNKNIPTLDFRESIQNSGLDHYSLFYKTDHHWTVDAGRIAAGWLGEYLNKDFGFKLDTGLTDKSKYTEKTYKDIFLGSLGIKVTLGFASPEDFSVSLPTFDTDFRIVAQDRNLDLTGDFASVMYDKERLEIVDYYNNNQYGAILYGNRPLQKIYNNKNKNGPKILFVRDSFSLALAPYFSLMAGEVDLIDMRKDEGNFNGSVKTFIEQEKPDMVVMMYQPAADETIQ